MQLTTDESPDRNWALHYDLDGRLKALNDATLSLTTAGLPMQFGKVSLVKPFQSRNVEILRSKLSWSMKCKVFHIHFLAAGMTVFVGQRGLKGCFIFGPLPSLIIFSFVFLSVRKIVL